jgi:hypothetical protein
MFLYIIDFHIFTIFFSPSRGDAAKRQRGFIRRIKPPRGDAAKRQRGFIRHIKSSNGEMPQSGRGVNLN